MGANAGPDIVSDGLVLALDAADNNSFRGEPTENLNTLTLSDSGTDGSGQSSIGTRTIISDNHVRIVDIASNTRQSHVISGLTGSTQYTISIQFKKLSGTPTFRFQIQDYSNSSFLRLIKFTNTTEIGIEDKDGWQLAHWTFTLGSDANAVRIWYQDGADYTTYTHSFELKNPQLEAKPYPTRFVNGTRGTTVANGGGWADISGNDNHGEILNGTSTSNDNTVLGALDFDGANDRVTIPAFTYTPYCIDFWLYNNSLVPNTNGAIGGPSTYQTLICFGASPAGVNLGGWTGGATNEALHIWSSSGSNRLTYTRDEPIPIGYHNWIFNWNGSQYDIWVDGEKLNTYAGGGGHASLITYTNQPLYLGTNANTYEFYGKIFKFKMYQSQLSDKQVLQNFNAHRAKFGL